ncbi:MAG: PQQ-binding-like beta-propeller repeat protein [Planctomycetaceae bacterium]
MAKLEICYFTGDVEERELTPTQPISVGRRASNDVCIDEDDVGAMHCRIAGNDNGYEVVAAGNDGVEVNGTLVQRAMLAADDVIRVGTVDITFLSEDSELAAAVAGAAVSEIVESSGSRPVVKPLPDELFAETNDLPPDEDDLSGDVVEAERLDDDQPQADVEEFEDDAERRSLKEASLAGRRWGARSARPGEREVLRSKFLNGLVALIAVLLLTSGVLYFWMQKDAAKKDYDEAVAKHEDGNYKAAIELYSKHLETYPANKSLTNKVWFGRAHARIQQEIEGSTPNWKEGLAQIQNFKKENRDREGYDEEKEKLLGYARKIALGACKSAERTRDRKYLPLAEEARLKALEFGAGEGFEADYKKAYRAAERIVVREELFVAARTEIDNALAKKPADIRTALEHRLGFLKEHPKLLRHERKDLDKRLKQTMEAERALVTATELNRNAETKDRPERARHAHAIALHLPPQDGSVTTRSQIVIAIAKHCVYGIDAGTLEPLWRRAIGLDTPFFPISVDLRVPALLVYDTDFGEAVLLNRVTGKLIWRQPLDAGKTVERLAARPLIHDVRQVFLPTLSRRLYQLDLDSGRLLSRLTFSQRVSAPAVGMKAQDQPRLVVAGERSLLYTLKLTPKLACESVSHLGQRMGSVKTPLVLNLKKLGSLLLLCENDRVDSCRLRVLNTSGKGEWLKELTFTEPGKEIRVDGWVHDVPLLRHNKLFVSSSGERVTVFTVSDDTNIAEAERDRFQFLRPVASYHDEKAESTVYPVYLQIGANGEFLMASNRLRKFHLKTSTVQPDAAETAFGRATQPPQVFGQQVYLGRQTGFSTAVWVTQHNREQMTDGRGRAVLGAKILAWSYTPGNKHVICLNEEGYIFRIRPVDLVGSRFTLRSFDKLRVPRGLKQPLRAIALPDGRIAAFVGGENPSLWLINSAGQTERKPIPGFPETSPIVMGNGLILPMPGRLRYFPLKGGGRVEDYEAPFVPAAKRQPQWTHLAAVGDTELVAGDTTGRLFRIQLRDSGGRRHLAKAVERKLDLPPSRGFAVHEGRVIVVDSQQTIRILNPTTLQPMGSLKTDGPVTNSLWVAGGNLFAEIGGSRLACYSMGDVPQKRWEMALRQPAGLAAAPQLRNGFLLIAERSGTLHWVDPANGAVKQTDALGEPLADLPRSIGAKLFVPSIDGALHPVAGPGRGAGTE